MALLQVLLRSSLLLLTPARLLLLLQLVPFLCLTLLLSPQQILLQL
jgi:hypothetical protein